MVVDREDVLVIDREGVLVIDRSSGCVVLDRERSGRVG